MGVHGLWRLLDTFGEVTQPEMWSGCRVAIDASIWIAQFRSQAPSEDASNRIIQGFFLRILKLLFYGIEPIFVFDGPTSALKAKEHRRRQTLRGVFEQSLLKRRAHQIVSALASSGHLDVTRLKRRETNERLPEPLEAQGQESGMKAKNVALLHTDCRKIRTEASFGHKKDESVFTGNLCGTIAPRSKSHHRKQCNLIPEEISKVTMLSFLNEAEDLIGQRKKGERCVLNNSLRYSSSSLFMGPRFALLSEGQRSHPGSLEALDCTTPEITIVDGISPHRYHSDVVLVDTDDEFHDASSVVLTISSSYEESSEGSLVQPSADAGVCKEQKNLSSTSVSIPHKRCRYESLKRALMKQSPEASRPDGKFLEPGKNKLSPQVLSLDDSIVSNENLLESSTSISSSFYASYCRDSDDDFSVAKGKHEAGFVWDPSTQRQYERLENVFEVSPHSTPLSKAKDDDMSSTPQNDLIPINLPSYGRVFSGSNAVLEGNDSHEWMSSWLTATSEGDVGGEAEVWARDLSDSARSAFLTKGIPGYQSKVIQRGVSFNREQFTLPHFPLPTTVPHQQGDPLSNPPIAGGGVCGDRYKRAVPFELLEIVNLLMCFQIPYVISPSEADAQCAYLACNGLVDAVFTEDSDVIVHGALVVLRGFFSSNKNVVAYRQAELEACGIDKRVLVALALLVGCDYTEGIPGLGLSGALEALVASWLPIRHDENERTNDTRDDIAFIINTLFRWKSLVKKMPTSWSDAGDNDLSLLQLLLFQRNKSSWSCLHLPEAFPKHSVAEAFYEPLVDPDRTPFLAPNPQWQQVWRYAAENGLLESSWVRQRLELAQKGWSRRRERGTVLIESGESRARQRHLEEFGMKTRIGERWAYKKQPLRWSTVLAQLRDIKKLRIDTER
ncbi:unnamed protein product [Phytomonas sp. EM1]|nr:unnamed protein product [Phytomonas sp. EM1]|eukprot:CCW61433.1 unnamed protein product [Phytomonas sp. isolate EM1]